MQLQPEALTLTLTSNELGFTPTWIWSPSPSNTHRLDPYDLPMHINIGIAGNPVTGAKYSPPPYAVGLGNADNHTIVGIQADDGWHLWNEVDFDAKDGTLTITLHLEGMSDPAEAANHIRVVTLAGSPTEDRYQLLQRQQQLTYPQSKPQNRAEQPDWWFKPIYCGWGDQVTSSMFMEGLGLERRAQAWCIQGMYQRWIDRLDEAGVPFGTIIIDHGWSPAGWWQPTDERWPDLKGFIKAQHDKGRKVLLWIPTWLHDGLPDKWCTFADDFRLTADPTNPEYMEHLRARVHELISPDGYDADGFKIDQLSYSPNQRHPRGGYRFGWTERRESPPSTPIKLHTPGLWGVELLYHLQKNIYQTAKAAKPDCLVTSSTIHPYFHDTFDMARLHDTGLVEDDVFVPMKARADLAHAAFPNIPIDSDDWVHTDYDLWMHYTSNSHKIGVPCIFYAEHFMLNWRAEPATKLIPIDDLKKIAAAWREAGF